MSTTASMTSNTTIHPTEVAALQANGCETLIIDVRSAAEWQQVHVDGAIHVPLAELEPDHVLAEAEQHPQRQVFVICQAGSRAVAAQKKFLAAGHENIRTITGGTNAWIAAGLPVIRGTATGIPLERQLQMTIGGLVAIGCALTFWVHPYFIAMPAFVGLGLFNAGLTGACPMAAVLARMPWNSRRCGNEMCATKTNTQTAS